MKEGLYERIRERAAGKCECQCGKSIPPAHADHFFGRAKAEESEATVWLLSERCDYEKTRNHPTVSTWLERFISFCKRHEYVESQKRAEARLFFADVRRDFARGATR